MAIRVRIFFINCPTLAVEAATYLLLAQNKAQSSLQFEIRHFWLYSVDKASEVENSRFKLWVERHDDTLTRFWWLGGSWLARLNRAKLDLEAAPHFAQEFNLETCFRQTKETINKYDNWVAHRSERGANNYDALKSAPVIVVTETPLPYNFISHIGNDRQLGIVSLSGWKRYFKPASALECALAGVQKIAVALCCSSTIGFHYPTRGCLFDYAQYVQDTRIGAFLGYLCETCKKDLERTTSKEQYHDITRLIENKWIGRRDIDDSVAQVLSRIYRYDLSRSTGLRPRFKDEIVRSIQSESGKVFWAVGVGSFIFLLAAYAPWIYRWFSLL